jgi:hypothetical protein
MTRLAKIVGAAVLALAAGCGSSSNDPGSPPVDGNTQISAATATDKMNLCNWYVGMVGGYGSTATCSMALLTAPPTEADCVTGLRPHDHRRAGDLHPGVDRDGAARSQLRNGWSGRLLQLVRDQPRRGPDRSER